MSRDTQFREAPRKHKVPNLLPQQHGLILSVEGASPRDKSEANTPLQKDSAPPPLNKNFLSRDILHLQSALGRLRRRHNATLNGSPRSVGEATTKISQTDSYESREFSFLQMLDQGSDQKPPVGTQSGTVERYTSEILFLVLLVVAIVIMGFSSNSFFRRRAPSPTVDFYEYPSLPFPVVTVCSAENSIPFFAQSDFLRKGRKIYDLTAVALSGGEVCTRDNESCYEELIEQGWISDGSDIDCASQFSAMSASRFNDRVALVNIPCRYCFRLASGPGREGDKVTAQSQKIGLQIATEYFDCVYRVGGIQAQLLGSGTETSSLNHDMLTSYRANLRKAGILNFSNEDLPADTPADFSSEQMCNLLLFSGYFIPSNRSPDQPMYQWSSDGLAWVEAMDESEYLRVLVEPTVEAVRALDIFLEIPDSEEDFAELQARGSQAMKSAPRGPILEAPRIRIGTTDLGLVRLIQREVSSLSELSWSAVSYPATLLDGSLFSCVVEFGFGTLDVEHYYNESRGDIFAYLENQLGWFQIFTGLSIYTIILKPVKRWTKRRRQDRDPESLHDSRSLLRGA